MRLYLSTIDPEAHITAGRYGLGLEIAEYCTASNMDQNFAATDPLVRSKLSGGAAAVMHGPFNELFPCAIDPLVRDVAARRYRQAIALAGSYGISGIVLHGGYNPRLYYPVWYTEQSAVFWRDFIHCVPEDMTIYLENVFEEEPEYILDILRQVDDPRLRLCLDTGHVNAYSPLPLADWLEKCAPWTGHFHIHNNDGSFDSHSPLYSGNIPMKEFLKRVSELCPDAGFTLELMDCAGSVRWLMEEIWKK